MKVSEMSDKQSDVVILAGKYLCKIAAVTSKTTQKGDPMWNMKFEILDGKNKDAIGNSIWENLLPTNANWKWKIVKIAKCVFDEDLEYEDITPEMFVEKKLMVTVTNKDWTNPATGQVETKVEIALKDGYATFSVEPF